MKFTLSSMFCLCANMNWWVEAKIVYWIADSKNNFRNEKLSSFEKFNLQCLRIWQSYFLCSFILQNVCVCTCVRACVHMCVWERERERDLCGFLIFTFIFIDIEIQSKVLYLFPQTLQFKRTKSRLDFIKLQSNSY